MRIKEADANDDEKTEEKERLLFDSEKNIWYFYYDKQHDDYKLDGER